MSTQTRPAKPSALAGVRVLPLSHAQKRFWFLHQLEGQRANYNVIEAVRLRGPLDSARLRSAFAAVAGRHDILRSVFPVIREIPRQVVLPHLEPAFILSAGRSWEEAAREESAFAFALEKGPLVRLTVIEEGGESRVLILNMHHIISDGWSVDLFFGELVDRYAGGAGDDPPPLQYGSVLPGDPDSLPEAELRSQLAYWVAKLDRAPKALAFPIDRGRPLQQTANGGRISRVLPSASLARLKEACAAGQCTPFVHMLASYKWMLFAFTGEKDLVVGSPVSGRHRDIAHEGCLGPFLNILALRDGVDHAESFRDFLAKVKRTVVEGMRNQDIPFDSLIEKLKVQRTTSHMPLAQAGFSFQQYPALAEGIPGLEAEILDPPIANSQADLSLIVSEKQGDFAVTVEYNRDLFERRTMETFLEGWFRVLDRVLAEPDSKVAEAIAPALEILADRHVLASQRQLWNAERLHNDPSLFRNIVIFELDQDIDIAAMRSAVSLVVEHSDGLRGTIKDNQGVPAFSLDGMPEKPAQFLDFSASAHPRSAMLQWVEQARRKPWKWGRDLFASCLFKLGEARFALYISHHHILTDGVSAMTTFARIGRVYADIAEGRDPAAGLAMYSKFTEYLLDDLKYTRSRRMDRDREFWERELARPIPPLTFYGRKPDPSSIRVDRVPFEIGRERTAVLHDVAASLRMESEPMEAAVSSLFGAALFAWLHKVSGGEKRLSAGLVNHNRRSPRFKDTIGLFMQVVPMVIDIEPGETFRTLIGKYRKGLAAVSRHGRVTVDNQIGRAAFDLLFNFHKEVPPDFAGRKVAYDVHVDGQMQSFGLNVTSYEASDNYTLQFDFNRGVFEADRYAETMNHYVTVLDAMIVGVDSPISGVCLLSRAERELIVDAWNRTEADFPLDTPFIAQLEAIAARQPDATAVDNPKERLTYAELWGRVMETAERLRQLGVRADAIVPVLSERNLEYLVGSLAILRAGGAILPLDPASPAERLRDMVKESGAAFVLADLRGRNILKLAGLPASMAVPLRSLAPAAAKGPAFAESGPADLAYLIFTSGSTGKPKAAMVEQMGMLNHLHIKVRELGLGPGDVTMQTAPQCFDISVWQFFAPLLSGGAVCIVPDSLLRNPLELLELAREKRVTVMELVPSYLRAFLEAAVSAGFRLPDLKCMMVTGEAFPVDLCRGWLRHFPGIPLVNAYGPTECADDVTHAWIRVAPPEACTTVPIGKALANTQLYLLDEGMQPVPPGIIGDLFVGGLGVGRGYFGNPGLTDKAFGANPFHRNLSTRLYRTGDKARYDREGTLHFCGRADHQVKIRGFRIELQEIEQVMRLFPGIRDLAVAVKQIDGRDVIIAYPVPADPGTFDVDRLKTHCGERLPAYEVPSYFLTLDELPLSANGKTDLAALPLPSREGATGRQGSPPVTARERALARVWEELLGVAQPGREDNFFDLGGDSIRAIQMSSMISQYGYSLQPGAILQSQTLAGIAGRLEENRVPAAPEGELPALDGDFPIAPPQARFLAAGHELPGHDHIATVLEFEALEPAVLAGAVVRAVSTFPHLRTVFHRSADGSAEASSAGAWRQSRDRARPAHAYFLDLGKEPFADEADVREAFSRLMGDTDLGKGPLFQVAHARSRGGHYVLIRMHHLLGDAVSFRVLADHLLEGMRGTASAGRPGLDYFHWTHALFARYARPGRPEVAYWRKATHPGDALPGRSAHPPRLREVSTLTADVPLPDSGAGSPGVAALAAFALACSRWTDRTGVRIGVIGTGRDAAWDGHLPDNTGTLGWMNTLYPLDLRMEHGADLATAAGAVAGGMASAPLAGMGYGAGKYITDELAGVDEPEIIFNYLGRREPEDLPPMVKHRPDLAGSTRHPGNLAYGAILLEATRNRDGVGLELSYDAGRFAAGEMEILLGLVRRALASGSPR